MEEDEGFDAEMASSTVVDRKVSRHSHSCYVHSLGPHPLTLPFSQPYDVQYVAKSPGDLRSAMDNEIAKVQSIFDLDVSPSRESTALGLVIQTLTLSKQSQTATLLLRSFNWNREKVSPRTLTLASSR